ncbi:MAG: DNA-directed RNA polymerase subunit alpha [Candidatus Magnetoovum sp. WYHC-5]|nr:DNA-directed RNA polymerase subunit alpha [Candidatus Magnetoovum sp. WYHC-5]
MYLEESGFHLPENVYLEEETLTENYGKLIAEPLERGYGITLGNALRRVLLSSIEGAAITTIKIENVSHEFSTVKGVKEDVVEIVLNMKAIRFKVTGDSTVKAYIDVVDKEYITAGDIVGGAGLEVKNPDLRIATLDEGASFKAELEIGKGRGYVPSEEIKAERGDLPIGTLPIDAIFTPVKKVVFNVEKTRVGKSTDYDKLILELWTDGSLTPKEAIAMATQILMRHLQFFLLGDFKADLYITQQDEDVSMSDEQVVLPETEKVVAERDEPVMEMVGFNKNLLKTVDELELSVRSQNCLKNADIKYLYELVYRSENDMLKMKNFGRKSLNEIREILTTLGLDFNMRIDVEAIKKKLVHKNGGN